MKCPKCGHTNCQYISESHQSTKGFQASNFGKSCCGYVLLGPLGLLCGMCGMGEKTTEIKEFWICNDCGSKFRADESSDPYPSKVQFYFENIGAYPEYESNEIVQSFIKIYKEEMINSKLATYISIRDNDNIVFSTQKRGCDRSIIEKETILFTLNQGVGIIVTVNGIFVGDRYIERNLIETISCYKNIVYVNGNGIIMHGSDDAKLLFAFLKRLLPNVEKGGLFTKYHKLLEVLSAYSNLKSNSPTHYSSHKEYGAYTRIIFDKEIAKFKAEMPKEYSEYEEYLAHKKKIDAITSAGVLVVCAFIGLLVWGIEFSIYGFFYAILAVVITLPIFAYLLEAYCNSIDWDNQDKKVLPEPIYELRRERDRSPMERHGDVLIVEVSENELEQMFVDQKNKDF